jgi:hypothetical protein
MIVDALELYFQTPREGYAYVTAAVMMDDSEDAQQHAAESRAWADLWLRYLHEMPRQKIVQLAEVLKLDLLHYKSSRRKKNIGR